MTRPVVTEKNVNIAKKHLVLTKKPIKADITLLFIKQDGGIMADLSSLNIDTSAVSDDAKLWALLSYLIPIVGCLVILFSDERKNDPFQRFHAVQAAALAVAISILSIVTCGIGSIAVIYMILKGIEAYKGEIFEIPKLTDFCMDKGWFNIG